jgi:6-phosphogluconolactonase (cycloisomerase 2 family)/mono/diheme cytochrome c family protein
MRARPPRSPSPGFGNRSFAYVADEDTHSVRTIDLDAGREIAATAISARPSHLLVLPDGRVVVGLRDTGRISIFEPGSSPDRSLESRCSVEVAPEPVALALSPDGATLYVSSGWGRALGAYDAKQEFRQRFELPLSREPRAVLLSDDGSVAFVAHAVGGELSRIDLTAEGHPRTDILPLHESEKASEPPPVEGQLRPDHLFSTGSSCQGYALAKTDDPKGRILAPQVLVDPGRPNQTPSGYGNDQQATEEANVAVVDLATGQPFDSSLARLEHLVMWSQRDRGFDRSRPSECLLPRAAAYDRDTRSLLVSCLGADAVVAYDALAAHPAGAEKRRWRVPAGPTGVVVDTNRHRALVWSQFERVVSTIELDTPEISLEQTPPIGRIALATDSTQALSPEVALGRMLFHAVGDGRISSDGRACASCHPEGRDDGIVWATPNGPRRSIMLAGRLRGTAPYSWEGDEDSLDSHLETTFDRLHGAGGLRSLELAALEAYLRSLPSPPSRPVAAADLAMVRRGAELFHSPAVGCSDCHMGDRATDNSNHDIQSKTGLDRSALFNTPTLHGVSGTGPYFHDGRYGTLREVLVQASGTMGDAAKLSPPDLDALEAYVRTL